MLNEIEKQNVLDLFVEVLQSAYDADPAAIHALICNRVPCNNALADHPTVVVDANRVAVGESYAVGLLGVLNGVCTALTDKRVAVHFSEAADEEGCRRILGFCEYNHEL